jgi:hypothetical protein
MISFPEQTMCSQINQSNVRYFCLAGSNGDRTLCDLINSTESSGYANLNSLCHMYLAVRLQDKKICESLPDKPIPDYSSMTSRQDCLYHLALESEDYRFCPSNRAEECYRKIAIATGNYSLCNLVQDRNHSAYCKAVIKEDPAICSEISNNSIWYSTCYGALANLTRTAALCEIAVASSYLKNGSTPIESYLYYCYYHGSFCELLPTHGNGIALRDNCLARRDKNITLCNNDSLCMVSIARETGNEELCEKMLDNRTRGSCYSELATSKCDISLCSRLQTHEEKDECVLRLLTSWCPMSTR